jgi:hypothetical protein
LIDRVLCFMSFTSLFFIEFQFKTGHAQSLLVRCGGILYQ